MSEPVRLPIYVEPVEETVVPPRTRGDCQAGGVSAYRPCPWMECRFHIAGSEEVSCVLDVAEQGGVTLEDVGRYLGVTRERIRQIETIALRKLKRVVRETD